MSNMSVLGVMSAGVFVRAEQKKRRGFCPQRVMSVYPINIYKLTLIMLIIGQFYPYIVSFV